MGIQITLNEPRTFEAEKLFVNAQVRYWEDADLNGAEDVNGEMPFREGDCWRPVIDLSSGVIDGWPNGVTARLHYKVCDAGIYTIKDANGSDIKTIHGYVPDILCPVGSGYGDYIIMEVDGFGKINKWNPVLTEFEGQH